MKWLCWFSFFTLGLSCFTAQTEAFKRTVSPQGKVLFWNGNNIPFQINDIVPPGLKAANVRAAIRDSFQAWTLEACTCLRFNDKGITTSTTLGYDQNKPQSNQNIILFQLSSWQHSPQAVAITSNIFNEDTGEVVAYDMELNSVNFVFSLTGNPRNGVRTMDIKNVVTHEVGHVIGLDHSPIRESTMFVSGQPGETKKRDLHADDISALCTIYPKDGCKQSTPQPGNNNNACGCQHNPNSPSPLFPLVLLALFAAGLLLRKQRQNR